MRIGSLQLVRSSRASLFARHREGQAAILCGHREPSRDTLNKFALIVLREAQCLVERRRGITSRNVSIERLENARHGNSSWPFLCQRTEILSENCAGYKDREPSMSGGIHARTLPIVDELSANSRGKTIRKVVPLSSSEVAVMSPPTFLMTVLA